MKKEKQILLSQEPCIVKKDFFDTHSIINEIIKILNIGQIDKNNLKETIQIIGIFDAYGEGKSTLIRTMKEKFSEDFCFIELDLWKYEDNELKYDFHKVFRAEKAQHYDAGKTWNYAFGLGQKFRHSKGVANTMATKRMFEHQVMEQYFRHGLREKIRHRKKQKCESGKIPIVVVENMDRLSIEEKIVALSSLYNYKDYFEAHILVALDPNAVNNSTTYFESLVHKCFTAYMHLSPKTKYSLKNYIRHQLPKITNEKIKTKSELENIYNELTEMLLTQYPISLREINHCINTYVMSFMGEEEYTLKFFIAILQVLYPHLYRSISENPYILKKFIHHANDTEFNGYSEYGIENEQRYKLNLLIKSLGDIEVDNNDVLSILSPLNKEFLIKKNYTLDDWIVRIEFLRKAYLEKDVIGQIENKVVDKPNEYTFEEFDKFFSETIKDRRTFINFFQSQSFEDIFTVLKGIVKETDKVSFLETILSYNLEGINDYSFYENYSRSIKLYLEKIKEKGFSELLVQRILENFQLTREMIEKGIVLESNEYLITKLKRLSFVNKILYITYFFPTINNTQDNNSIKTVNHIIKSSIRDLDIKKLENIEQYKQNIIKNFYLKDIPIGRYPYATIELLKDIIESTIFEQLDFSEKLYFYDRVFNNHKLMKQEEFNEVVRKFSKLLNEVFTIEDTEVMVDILIKVRASEMLDVISSLSLKKFITDSIRVYGKYDEGLRSKLVGLQ